MANQEHNNGLNSASEPYNVRYADLDNLMELYYLNQGKASAPEELKPTLTRAEKIAEEFPGSNGIDRERLALELENLWEHTNSVEIKNKIYCGDVLFGINRVLNYPPIKLEGLRRRITGQEWSARIDDNRFLKLFAFFNEPIDPAEDKDEKEFIETERVKLTQQYHEKAFEFERNQYGSLEQGLKKREYSYPELFTTPQEFQKLGVLLQVWWSQEQYYEALRYQERRIQPIESVKRYGMDNFGYETMIKQFASGLEPLQKIPGIPEVEKAKLLLKGGLENTNRAYTTYLRDELRDGRHHYREEYRKIMKIISASGHPSIYYGISKDESRQWSKLPANPLQVELSRMKLGFKILKFRDKITHFLGK